MASETILIVEDNPINLKLVKLLLTIEGYDVHTASNAHDALVVLETIRPQLILMDIQLPGKNGLDLIREIKSQIENKNIFIVALTAYAMKGDEIKAKNAGCDGYMTKPISAATFPTEISHFLSLQRSLFKHGQ